MGNSIPLRCDGCGQSASPEHLARRLKRLEWTTRYRPVHIGTLLLAAVAPESDEEFIYSGAAFRGEAGLVLHAAGISPDGKPAETTLAELQRGGFLIAHVLECPLEAPAGEAGALQALLVQQWAGVATRIRRSLKPKKVALISRWLEPLIRRIDASGLGCALVLDNGKPFDFGGSSGQAASRRLSHALSANSASAR